MKSPLRRCSKSQDLQRFAAVGGDRQPDLWPLARQCAGLVGEDRVDLAQKVEGAPVLHENPLLAHSASVDNMPSGAAIRMPVPRSLLSAATAPWGTIELQLDGRHGCRRDEHALDLGRLKGARDKAAAQRAVRIGKHLRALDPDDAVFGKQDPYVETGGRVSVGSPVFHELVPVIGLDTATLPVNSAVREFGGRLLSRRPADLRLLARRHETPA
jgi:hypothetical protein